MIIILYSYDGSLVNGIKKPTVFACSISSGGGGVRGADLLIALTQKSSKARLPEDSSTRTSYTLPLSLILKKMKASSLPSVGIFGGIL